MMLYSSGRCCPGHLPDVVCSNDHLVKLTKNIIFVIDDILAKSNTPNLTVPFFINSIHKRLTVND